jgi:hypothetical protein
MKELISRIGRLAEKTFILFFGVMMIFVCAIIADDIVTGWSSSMKPESLLLWVRYAARTGILLILMAFLYLILRSTAVSAAKRGRKMPHIIDRFLKITVPLSRSVHPLIGVTALSVLALHGYFVFYRIYGLGIDPMTLSGATVFIILLLIGIAGLRLRKHPSNKTIRLIHRSFAFLLLAGFIVHRILVKMLAG